MVASNQTSFDGGIVIFNLNEWEIGCDESCVIEPGEHPFVIKKSYVFYRRGLFLTRPEFQKLEQMGCIKDREPVSKELLIRIQRGALHSDFAAQEFQAMVRDSLVE